MQIRRCPRIYPWGVVTVFIIAWAVYIIGLVIPLVLVILYFQTTGVLTEFLWQAITYNSYYVRSLQIGQSLQQLRSSLYELWPQLSVLFALALLALLQIKRSDIELKKGLIIFGGWGLVEVIIISLSGRFFLYYFIPLMPPLILLSVLSLKKQNSILKEISYKENNSLIRHYWIVSLIILVIMAPLSQGFGLSNTVSSLVNQNLFSSRRMM